MAQAKYGTGTVYQTKDGRFKWQGYYVDSTGKKHRPSKIFNTEQEALIFQAEQLKKTQIKKVQKSKDLTFNAVCELWKEDVKNGVVVISETTRKNTIQNLNKHLIPLFEDNLIKNLSVVKIKRYINNLKEQGRSEKTLYNIYTDLKKIVNYALDKGYIYENPIADYVVKQPKVTGRPVNVMSFKEYELIMNNEQNKKLYYYWTIMFLAETGLRSEELAIKKQDYVIAENGTPYVLIDKSIVRALNDDDKTTTLRLTDNVKSEASKRRVPLNIFAQNAVENQLAYCKEHNIRSPFIFCTTTGTMLEKRNLLRALHSMCRNAGIEKRGLHSLRKEYINHTLKNGVQPFDLAKITGHSIQTMYKYYHDLDDDLLQRVANASESRK